MSGHNVIVLAGGLGTRMLPLTRNIPKILIPLCGKPFIIHQLELFEVLGVKKVTYCLGYLGEMVVDEIKKHKNFDIDINFSFDGDELLGTGGAVKKASSGLNAPFFVTYGDSYLKESLNPIAEKFTYSKKNAMMCIYKNRNAHDMSNIVFTNDKIVNYNKVHTPDMEYIDYGLTVFKPSTFDNYQCGIKFDLGNVIKALIYNDNLDSYEAKERFYEIGSPQGLKDLENFLLRNI